jgi:hypothetical protein
MVSSSFLGIWMPLLQFSWPEPGNEYRFLGNQFRSFHFHSWFGFIFIPHWKYADIFAVNNDKIGGNESKEEGCRTVDVSSVAS